MTLVPVEQLQPGQIIILPRGRRVTVERVDVHGTEHIVRWTRPHPDHPDGIQLGSLIPVRAGHEWQVA